MYKNILPLLFACISSCLYAQPDLLSQIQDSTDHPGQEYVTNTFTDTRLINAPTNEMLKKRYIDFRVAHKFGDIAGQHGGWENFYGLEEAADIRIGFHYGISDRLNIGFSRSKGTTQRKALLEGLVKYAILRQTQDNTMPVSLAIFGNAVFSSMKKSSDTTLISSFPKFAHRFTYVTQLMVARKFSDRFSFAIIPAFNWQNYVLYGEENALFFAGAATRIKVTEAVSLALDYYFPLNATLRHRPLTTNPLGIGFEIETGGHIFTFELSNSKGIIPNEFLPYTDSDWLDGEFRFGFNISRLFIK